MSAGISARAREEAVRWFSLLHGPGRTGEADVLFRKWCQASEDNEAAYDQVTQVWDQTRYLRKDTLPMPRKWQRAGFRSGLFRAVGAVAIAVAVIAVASFFYMRSEGLHTQTGEQRTVTLEDGTRVSLNTQTQLLVRFDARQRAIVLKSGEALFEVAQDPRRPFIVRAGEREIKALGTVFVVRSEGPVLAVTLVEGKVSVSTPTAAEILNPGERLILGEAVTASKRDRPEVQRVMAWRQGRIEMDRMPLYQAVVEMNRYSKAKLTIEQPEAQVIPVTGSFRTGDLASFADTLARTCQLQLQHKPDEFVLSGVPSANCR